MAEYHVRQRVLVRWERSKPGEHDVYAGRVLELYGEFGPRDRFTQMKALVQYELSDWRLWHKMAELSPLDEDADVAAPPDDDLCVADTKWQLFSTRCRYSFAPLTDPARCSACVHPSCCNYDALVTCLQSTRTCPIAGCNAANVRCRGIIRDDALRNSLAHLPPNTETFWLRGHAEIALQPPPTASSSALTTSDSSRQRPQLTIDGDASRRSSVRQRRAVELFAPGQGGGQKRRRVQQERPGGCAQGEAQPIIVDEDEEDGEEGEGEQEEQEEQEEAEAEAAGDGVVREACGMQLHLSSRNATGYCGVYRGHCGVGKITVTFQARRNGKYLGTWPTAVEAAVAYACAPESEEQSNAQQHIHMDDAGGHERNSEVEHPPEEEEEPVAQRAKHVAEAQGKQAAAERSALAKDKKALSTRERRRWRRERRRWHGKRSRWRGVRGSLDLAALQPPREPRGMEKALPPCPVSPLVHEFRFAGRTPMARRAGTTARWSRRVRTLLVGRSTTWHTLATMRAIGGGTTLRRPSSSGALPHHQRRRYCQRPRQKRTDFRWR